MRYPCVECEREIANDCKVCPKCGKEDAGRCAEEHHDAMARISRGDNHIDNYSFDTRSDFEIILRGLLSLWLSGMGGLLILLVIAKLFEFCVFGKISW